jgi:hypothetical protein
VLSYAAYRRAFPVMNYKLKAVFVAINYPGDLLKNKLFYRACLE